jgi:hypothetical protein
MSKAVRLGDCRILEQGDSELFKTLMNQIDPSSNAFRSPGFDRAMNDTRSGIFVTLQLFLDDVQDGNKQTQKKTNPTLMFVPDRRFVRANDISLDPKILKREVMDRLKHAIQFGGPLWAFIARFRHIASIWLDEEVQEYARYVLSIIEQQPDRSDAIAEIKKVFQV